MTTLNADAVRPAFTPRLSNEPVPVNGCMAASALDRPGFGVVLNPEVARHRKVG
ncbi:hypothetical protein MKK88_12620 [Methylobacterium sp. E-005]|uniref:hypothetical protein n=1 Tax=Methylobacterium sp. E-005 TaxID=2836549 RepID=UPI001FB8A0A4|nr:hypothetical protein [Methylobacterium sp. E-005]MCJ2086830.1 hypothetical protein [Methylobacterium sp. E-005]